MIRKLSLIIAIAFVVISCGKGDNAFRRLFFKYDVHDIYSDLKKDDIYKQFIGYHIVYRDLDYPFFYADMCDTLGLVVVPKLHRSEPDEDPFLKKYPSALPQFNIMEKYGIRAVSSLNYNTEAKRLEYNDNGGYSFDKYKLSFAIDDSTDLVNINFGLKNYKALNSRFTEIVEVLDSNWVVVKN